MSLKIIFTKTRSAPIYHSTELTIQLRQKISFGLWTNISDTEYFHLPIQKLSLGQDIPDLDGGISLRLSSDSEGRLTLQLLRIIWSSLSILVG